MRRSIIVAASVAGLCLCGILGARLLVASAGRAAERVLARLAGEHGLVIEDTSCRKTSIRWPGSILCEGLALRGRGAGQGAPLAGDFTLSVDSATATFDRFGTRAVAVTLDGLLLNMRGGVRPAADPSPAPVDSVSGRQLTVRAPVDLLRPRATAAQLKGVLEEIRRLFRTGRCTLPVTFDGTVTFPFNGSATAGIRVSREGAVSVLTMSEEDLLALSGRLGLKRPMTPEEAAFLARRPVQVPRLLAIRDQARAQSKAERRRDARFPEDAYRHLLWSYLLTKAYGERFATEVTDAHEQGRTGNTDAERRMDLSNNALGRWYARSGVPPAALPGLASSDGRVIRTPGEVARKKLFGGAE